jgi:hypothetical protein
MPPPCAPSQSTLAGHVERLCTDVGLLPFPAGPYTPAALLSLLARVRSAAGIFE